MKIKLRRIPVFSMVFALLFTTISPVPTKAANDSIRIGTYNLAAGTKPDLQKMNELLSGKEIDVVGVQEVDHFNDRNNYDMLAKFEEFGTFMFHDFQKSINYGGGEYGVGTISKIELKDSKGGSLTNEGSFEARSWQRSIVEKNGKQIAVYNTHLTHESVALRQRQLSELLAIMDADPTEYKVLTGDFNTDTGIQENYPFLQNYNIANGKDGKWFDTYNHEDADMNVYCIDNIVTSRNLKLTNVEMVENTLSDHNLLYADYEFLDVEAPSKELLNFTIKDAEKFDAAGYTTDSFAILTKAIDDAKKLSSDAVQASIHAAVQKIKDAMANLVEQNENLALHKNVTVSGSEVAGSFGGELAVDGIVSKASRWSGAKANEQWLQVDLGSVQSVNKVVLNFFAETSVYNVYVSVDGINYDPILQVNDGSQGEELIKDIEFETRQVRYIKYEQKKLWPHTNGESYSSSLYEIEAYYDENSPFQPLIINDAQVGSELHEFNFQGEWKTSTNYPELFYGGDEHWFNFKNYVEGDVVPYVTIKFKGTGIELYGNIDKSMGIYDFSINDGDVESVDAYAPTRETQTLLFEKKGLPYGEYTVKMQLTKNKNAASSSSDGEIDFAKVFGVKSDEVEEEKGSLNISPNPRHIDYKEHETAALTKNINIVATHQDIAENSLNRLKEALTANGHTFTISSEASTTETNIILMPNAKHCAKCIEYLTNANIVFDLDHNQASLVDVAKTEAQTNITIISKDVEGLYYGIVNVEALLEQKVESDEIYEVAISDYPNLGYRGFIEGFFGPPWTHAGRLELLEFSGQMKMNRYIYGPKDDPYHRTKWREEYPEALGKQISELAAVSEKNNVEFTWAVHTTLGGDTIDFESTKDRADLLAKFESMYDLGVRSFSMFFDDITDNKLKDPVKQADLANFINREFISKKSDVKALSVVPYEYSGIVPSYLTPFGETLDENIVVLWTGSSVCPDKITKQDLTSMKEALGREVLVWWNYPVNDYWYDTPGRLFMGPVTGLDKNIDNTSGILSNPMSWESASQIALYGLADFSWNPKAYDAQETWEKSIEKLVPDQAEAMKLFSKNSSHLGTTANMKIRRNDSDYLNAYFEEFNKKRDAKESILDISNTLITEFDKMSEAANILRTIENTALVEEISPWLDQFEQVGIAGSQTMKMYQALERNDMKAAKEAQNKVNAAFAFMKENKRETSIGAMPVLNILVATQYVVPFIETNFNKVNDAFYFENENIKDMSIAVNVITYDGPNDDQPDNWVAEKAIDKDLSTKLWTAVDQKDGQEIKVTFDKEEELHVVSIYMSGGDTVKKGVLQYSLDGTTWIDLADMAETKPEGAYTRVQADAKGAKAKYVRVLVTGQATAWIQMNEIIFTKPNEDIVVDKTQLEATYNKYKDEVESKYTADSWAVFKEALEDAKRILADDEATKEIVDLTNTALQEAADALQLLDFKAEKALLLELINECEKINLEDFAEGIDEFKVALAEAKVVYADANATLIQINTAMAKLTQAKDQLVRKEVVDTSKLETLISEIEKKVGNGDNYKKDNNWTIFEQTLKAAKALLTNKEATQQEINTAESSLSVAFKGLVVIDNISPIPPVAKDVVKMDEATGIIVSGTEVTLDKDALLVVEKLTQEVINQIVAKTNAKDFFDKVKVEDMFNISLMKNNVEVQPNGKISVKIKLSAEQIASGKTFSVLYVDDKGNIVNMNAITASDYIVFETTHLSTYALVSDKEELPETPEKDTTLPKEEESSDDVNTGDTTSFGVFLTFAMMSGALLVFIKKRKEV